ncbi:MAG: hypothetical protein HDR80_08090 [Bacteroides sp.]|nr:hypothetical protein [Bacteroides sp.]MBD5371088.1 hypothetical protein [Bacteroides sp.]
MTFLIVLIVLVLGWYIFGTKIKAWLQGMMIRRMEDSIRKGMGMPSRKEEEKARRRAEKEARKHTAGASPSGSASAAYSAPTGHIIPPEYAEDVEYTEYREYSETIDITAAREAGGNTRVKVESQVSDAEYIEIKE